MTWAALSRTLAVTGIDAVSHGIDVGTYSLPPRLWLAGYFRSEFVLSFFESKEWANEFTVLRSGYDRARDVSVLMDSSLIHVVFSCLDEEVSKL